MDFPLTWNLVLTIGFLLMFAYHFILGQDATVKMIISIYVSILTADGVSNLLKDYVFELAPGFQEMIGGHKPMFYIGMRLILFMICIVVFVTKGGLKIELEKHEHWAYRGALHGVFAILSACLFTSTILIYISGSSFVEGMMAAPRIDIYKESQLARILIDYYQIWFSLPAMAFFITSFIFERKPKKE